MKFTNVKRAVLTGVVMGAALFTFNFTALPGSVNLPAVVQAAEANFTGEEAGKLYLTGQLYTGVALKDGKLRQQPGIWQKNIISSAIYATM